MVILTHHGTLHNECTLETMKRIEDGSVRLIIADPGYFQVKGEFDFIWNTMEEYQADIDRWGREWARILHKAGSLFVYGHALNIAYVQVVLDKYFNLENNAVWRKTDCQNRRGTANNRKFSPVTERILFYSKEVNKTGLQEIHDDPGSFPEIKAYMRAERDRLMKDKGMTTIRAFNDWVNEWTGTSSVVSRHYFADSQYHFPTPEIYSRLQESGYWQRAFAELREIYDRRREEYDGKRAEYKAKRRYWNNSLMLDDVWDFSQQVNITRKSKHETKKPPALTRMMIETTTRPGDLVYIPFGGSGTEAAECEKTGRPWICSEINPEFCEMIRDRVSPTTPADIAPDQDEPGPKFEQLNLFNP